MTHLPCIHSPELGFWTGDTPLGSPDFPFTRFYVPIVDVELDIDFFKLVGAAPLPKWNISEGRFRGILNLVPGHCWLGCFYNGRLNDKQRQGSIICKDRTDRLQRGQGLATSNIIRLVRLGQTRLS